jgi:hypothetical protein
MTNQLPDANILSPAAQAVLDAAWQEIDYVLLRHVQCAAAAALRAAADQVVPMEKEPAEPPGYGIGYEPPEYVQDWACWHIRRQFLAIAAELDGTTPTES